MIDLRNIKIGIILNLIRLNNYEMRGDTEAFISLYEREKKLDDEAYELFEEEPGLVPALTEVADLVYYTLSVSPDDWAACSAEIYDSISHWQSYVNEWYEHISNEIDILDLCMMKYQRRLILGKDKDGELDLFYKYLDRKE